MWYIRGKLRGVAILAVILGIFGLMAGDFGEITWYFLGGGILVWVVVGLIFQDGPSPQKALQDMMNGRAPSRRDLDALIDQRLEARADFYAVTEEAPQELSASNRVAPVQSADLQAPKELSQPSSEQDFNESIHSLANSIAEELASAWQYQESVASRPMIIANKEIQMAIKLASARDDRINLGAKAMLSHLVKANLQSKGFTIS